MQPLQTSYSGARGVGRYTSGLVHALLESPRKHEIWFALNGALDGTADEFVARFGGLIPQDRVCVWRNYMDTAASREGRHGSNRALVAAAQILREGFLASLKPDVVLSTNLQEGFADAAITGIRAMEVPYSRVTVLHDLTPFHFKRELLSDEVVREWYRAKIDDVRLSDAVITDSIASRTDIIELLGIDPARVFVVPAAHDEKLFSQHAIDEEKVIRILGRYNIPRKFLFYFGGNDLCKNVPRLLRAYKKTNVRVREAYPLVLGGQAFLNDRYGGSHVDVEGQIETLGLEGDVLRPGFIAEDDLPILLKACAAFVFPSTHEGFGLPPLEAMACGVPVIASERSSVGEVVGNAEALFDPYDEQSIADKIEKVLTDQPFRDSLRNAGLARAEAFSWSASADKLLKVLESQVEVKAQDWFGDALQRTMQALKLLTPGMGYGELADLARSLDASFPAVATIVDDQPELTNGLRSQ